MGRASTLILVVLLVAGCGGGAPHSGPESSLGPYGSPQALVEAVECGEAGPDVFVRAVRGGPVRLEEMTPEAVANYLEALAYDRMLDCVPPRYVEFDEMVTSYETVFEDSRNVFNNWEAYKTFLQRVYRADMG
ncbi:MAG: hypothetical protein K9M82_08455 [Deltaproteobacteria bacterium]|nr:hypothetical protein [Deltaproteobacteria bacterium]